MKKSILLLILFMFQTILFAQTSVWKIQKGEDTVYLGGTIHILRSQDYPLPKEFDKAYNNSDSIYFETDLQTLDNPDIQKVMFSSMRLDSGEKLSNILSPDIYKELNNFAKSKNINLSQYENFKVSLAILSLTVAHLKSMGIDTDGVDKYYLQKALKDKKYLGKLESVMRHISYISNMGEGEEDNLVKESLKDFIKTKKYFSRIISAWRTGSTQTLYKLLIANMRKNSPKLYESILVERNYNWMPVIKSLFGNNQTEFVLVGAAHLVGNEGLLELLKKQGYQVRKLK